MIRKPNLTFFVAFILIAGIPTPFIGTLGGNNWWFLLIWLLISSAISFMLSTRSAMQGWKKRKGGIAGLPPLKELVRACLVSYLIFLVSSTIIFGALTTLFIYVIGLKSSDILVYTVAGVIAFVMSTSIPYIITSKMAITKWIEIETSSPLIARHNVIPLPASNDK